jgi:hypothetical protein
MAGRYQEMDGERSTEEDKAHDSTTQGAEYGHSMHSRKSPLPVFGEELTKSGLNVTKDELLGGPGGAFAHTLESSPHIHQAKLIHQFRIQQLSSTIHQVVGSRSARMKIVDARYA